MKSIYVLLMILLPLIGKSQTSSYANNESLKAMIKSGKGPLLLSQNEALIVTNPADIKPYLTKGQILSLMNKPDLAIETYKSVLNMAPKNQEANTQLGILYYNKAGTFLNNLSGLSAKEAKSSKYKAYLLYSKSSALLTDASKNGSKYPGLQDYIRNANAKAAKLEVQ
ncbi:hypothetical protein [Pedobacter sp. MR2016-24]|uniref:tetratricopeptide repeat protein n=1 Tax=Pedobacter sp. MR2016-24 TaxID=2994466 RepID=UPI0022486F92|nr:hypothetical protein [Pedobacter sp. MR2016-24]MCX2484223.1 hypothetical protein [Pedobacter sp. MR2016-24]